MLLKIARWYATPDVAVQTEHFQSASTFEVLGIPGLWLVMLEGGLRE